MTSSSCFVFLLSFLDFLKTPLKEVIHQKKINSDMKKYWYLVKKTNCCLHKQRPLWRWTNKEKASPTPGSWLARLEHCSKLSWVCSTLTLRLFWKMSLLCLPVKIAWKFPTWLQHCSTQRICSPPDGSCDDFFLLSWTWIQLCLFWKAAKVFMLLVFSTRQFPHHCKYICLFFSK